MIVEVYVYVRACLIWILLISSWLVASYYMSLFYFSPGTEQFDG